MEMEALSGAAVAALTVYDMCKAAAKDMVVRDTQLVAGPARTCSAPGPLAGRPSLH